LTAVPNGIGTLEIKNSIKYALYPKIIIRNFLQLTGVWGPFCALLRKEPYWYYEIEGGAHRQYRSHSGWVSLFQKEGYHVINFMNTISSLAAITWLLKSRLFSIWSCRRADVINVSLAVGYCFALRYSK